MTLSEQEQQTLAELIAAKSSVKGGLLPILHDIQDHFGFIPKAAIDPIAQGLQQTSAEIYGVISFYHHFTMTPPGQQVVEICRGEACQAVGSRDLEAEVKADLGIDYGQTTVDKKVTLKDVYCLGNCACGPSVKIGEQVFARMSKDKLDRKLQELESQKVSLSGESL